MHGAVTPSSSVGDAATGRRARWSVLMLPGYVVAYVLLSIGCALLLRSRGQTERALLAMTEDVPGVVLETLMFLVQLAPAAFGVVLAGLAAKGLLVVLTVYQCADAMRMSFAAPLDQPGRAILTS